MAPGPRDESLVKALARARAWFEDIRLQHVQNVSELAARLLQPGLGVHRDCSTPEDGAPEAVFLRRAETDSLLAKLGP